MARLPTPGQDGGTWGNVLNEYLSTSHAADGTLKADVVATSQLQNTSVTSPKIAANAVGSPQLQDTSVTNQKLAAGAVTTPKIADGSITANKLAPGVVSSSNGLRSLLIFYAPPNIINGQFNDAYASGILSRYDDIVLGTGLEDPSSPYYASTTAIISSIYSLSPNSVVWGYIDCGVTTGNFSLAALQTQIDQWIAIGAKGIFCDVIGYAYHTPRSRQNAIIDYIHSKGVGAFLNSFNPDEILSPAVDATYNPSGTASSANSTDVLLLESWVFNSDAYANPFYATFSDVKTRADAARAYRNSMGIRIFATNIMSHNDHSYSQLKSYRDFSEALARVFRLDGSGIGASNYSSTGGDAGLVTAQFSSFQSIPLRPTAPYVLNGGWTQIQAPDLGITVNYDTGTHTWSQQ
jgi:hypothetical protein